LFSATGGWCGLWG